MKISAFYFLLATLMQLPFLLDGTGLLAQEQTVKGIVYHDKNGNEAFEPGVDIPLDGVAVSNGREVVITNQDGVYELPLRDNSAIFVIKPRNWMVPLNENRMPKFYYLHSPHGATGSKFEGLPPSGPVPRSVDFPLYPQDEPDSFEVLVFGDTQPRDKQEIHYLGQDIITELTGIDAAFGVTLGDVVFDDLDLFEPLTGSIATIGIPWRYVPGNHDIDFTADNNTDTRGPWYRTFGPSYYSFSHGPAHFIVIDNIRWIVEEDNRYYRTGLGEDQMEFIKNEISRLASDQLLVLMTHIPWTGSTAWQDEQEQDALYELIAGHPNSVSLVAHTHRHFHYFIGEEDGFTGQQPHHMVSVGTVCGSWWTGAPDEYGIPHAMMSDGTPTSYTFLHINGNEWKMSWKAARRPSDFQMHIHAPETAQSHEAAPVTITANIFNALPSAEVNMRIGRDGEWIRMERNPQHDPFRLAAAEREKGLENVPWRNLGGTQISEHIWTAETDINMEPGVYLIEIRAVDDWWQYEGRRLIHVN